VDDGSTDGTPDKVAAIDDSRLKYIRYGDNQGATHARNVGIANASGRFIAFQDSDDEWLPDKLMKQVKLLENSPSDVGVCFTGYWWIVNGRKIRMPIDVSDTEEAKRILSRQFFLFVGTPTVLIKRDYLLSAGCFDERLMRLQEWELWIRMSQLCLFEYANEPLVVCHHQEGGLTSNYERLAKSFDLIYEKHKGIFESDKRSLARILAIFGRHLLSASDSHVLGRDYIKKSVLLNPFCPRHLFYFLFSLFGFKASDTIRKSYRSLKDNIHKTLP